MPAKTWLMRHQPILQDQHIVEVTMELALAQSIERRVIQRLREQGRDDGEIERIRQAVAMSTSVGGLGPLLKERITLQAELGARVSAVTLLYDAVWVQRGEGLQPTAPVAVGEILRRALEETGVVLPLTLFDGTTVRARVFKSRNGDYGKAAVYFLDAPEVLKTAYIGEADAPEGTADRSAWRWEALRKQEWLLGRGTLVLLRALGPSARPDVQVLNEAAAVFAMHSLVQDASQGDPFFRTTLYLYNDHTPRSVAHPTWTPEQMARLGVDPRYVLQIPSRAVTAEGREMDTIDVTRLLWLLSVQLFGVSLKHAEHIARMPGAGDIAGKVRAVTNGVSEEAWQDPRFRDPRVVEDEERLWGLKAELKERLIQWLAVRLELDAARQEHLRAAPLAVWIRRVTSYKRLDLLVRMVKDPHLLERFLATGVVYLIGGRVHQDDGWAKEQVRQLDERVASDARLQRQVLVVRNYNVWDAPVMFQGANATTMISDPWDEAAATGRTKGQLNGSLDIATADGVVPEFVTFHGRGDAPNGFLVPYPDGGPPTAEGLVGALEQFAGVYRDRPRYLAYVRNALAWDAKHRRLPLPHPASLTRTVIKQFDLYANAVYKRDIRHVRDEAGARAGEDAGRAVRAADARALLALRHPFSWEFLHNMTTPWEVRRTAGLVEFTRTLRELFADFGSVGEWVILRRSAGGVQEYGSLIDHVLTYFPDADLAPALDPARHYLRELASQSAAIQETRQDRGTVARKLLEIHRELAGFLEAFIARVEAAGR